MSLPPPQPRRRTDGDDEIDAIPPLRDPRWREWTRPLLELLRRPRRWDRMMGWATAVGVNEAMLRQMVAALEEFGEAESIRHGDGMVWRQQRSREHEWAAPSLPQETPPDEPTTACVDGC